MEFLSAHDIPFVEKNVREDAAALQEIIGMGFQSTPILVIDGEPMAGFVPSIVKEKLGI